ncbi:MAG: hypothetical protein ACYS15_18710 [Planctomycetota bacterium]|jgi:hypothetical protein
MPNRRNGTTTSKRILIAGAAIAMGLGLVISAGCTSSRSSAAHTRPLPPKPRPLQPAPPDARANALVLNVSAAPLDTNGNGYPDLIHATAHLFDTRYPPAIKEDGTFVFHMYASGQVGRPDVEPIQEWRIEGEALEQAHARSAFGECYRFRLSLLDGGTDRLPISMADIQCRFEPADGREATYAGEVTSIRIGRRVLVPQLRWEESAETAGRSGSSVRAPVLEPAR